MEPSSKPDQDLVSDRAGCLGDFINVLRRADEVHEISFDGHFSTPRRIDADAIHGYPAQKRRRLPPMERRCASIPGPAVRIAKGDRREGSVSVAVALCPYALKPLITAFVTLCYARSHLAHEHLTVPLPRLTERKLSRARIRFMNHAGSLIACI